MHAYCVILSLAHHMCWLMNHIDNGSVDFNVSICFFLWLRLCTCLAWVVCMVVVFLWFLWLTSLLCQCIRSHSSWCQCFYKWMSFPSSHLDPSCPHTSSHSKPLSSVVPATRWFPPECHHIIWGFLHNHWPCTCHNIHSQSQGRDPTWIWVFLLWTHS